MNINISPVRIVTQRLDEEQVEKSPTREAGDTEIREPSEEEQQKIDRIRNILTPPQITPIDTRRVA